MLTDAETPATVANFLDYVDAAFYDDLVFHRVIEDFMVQGGGFSASLHEKSHNAAIVNEASTGLSNLYGTIAMARTSDPDSATDEFYINVKDNTFLDYSASSPGYCAFGRVIDGMDVVLAISKVATHTQSGMSDIPSFPVTITSARRVDCNALSFDTTTFH